MRQWDVESNSLLHFRLSQLQYYCYRLFERRNEYSTILRANRLFQEFVVDAWASTEQNRLHWYSTHQPQLRTELYQSLSDVDFNGAGANQVGQRVILPSSFSGSARHMNEIFHDSMALTRFYGHPDVFLTMTANPKWPEITSALYPHQTALDRPDLVARVFELKRKALMNEVKIRGVFGRKVAHVYKIEFQKRGLPHMHALFFLAAPDKIRTVEQVDRVVCAEFPDENTDPDLFRTVKSCMIHGPCGDPTQNAPCMENGRCTKGYPKSYVETTTMSEDGYPLYRRRIINKRIIVRRQRVDNRNVVPYNPHLSRMFDCHINVEVCAGIQCVRYVNKYIYKGHDRATIVLGGVDEVQEYLNARYIGPAEAAWRLFEHSLHEEFPTVMRLALHMPGQHHVLFDQNEDIPAVLARAKHERTTLTAFFALCSTYEPARAFTYQECPQHFVYSQTQKAWTPRQRGYSIGRLYFAAPNAGERFYLRLLLTVVKGPQSFEHLRTVGGVVHPTFKAACAALGLLEDDGEWVLCLQEAVVLRTGSQLRRLFCTILAQCHPLNPLLLWNQFSVHICDDLAHRLRTQFSIPEPTQSQIEDYGLYLIENLLQESGQGLVNFPPMPQPIGKWAAVTSNRLMPEHKLLIIAAQNTDPNRDVARLNTAQHVAYNAITSSVFNNKGHIFFLNGGAGTGKTFLYNTMATKCRELGHIVITVASSGIASLLLVGGRTAHSTFSIPFDVQESSFCNFSKQTMQAQLFRETTLIIWDEVPMQHRHCVEAVDRTLRDIRDDGRPFGGITVVLGGDFRQILPVIPKGVREQIVGASLKSSTLWSKLRIITLDLNMRLQSTGIESAEFAQFLAEVGTNPRETVELPSSIKRCATITELLAVVYPRLDDATTSTAQFLMKRAILSARNDDVAAINAAALQTFPGDTFTYLAADKMSEADEANRTITNRYPTEYLNSLDPPGIPPFRLDLKVGAPIMLLRNIAPKDGLCNGTRLLVVSCSHRVIQDQILTGDKAGDLVFIPRISLTPSSADLPFEMTRRQFPVQLAYAMTINKSQGQSLEFVGVDLSIPVFSHGQLYVALSRCTSYAQISVLLPTGTTNSTTNIVYPEVL